jgi:hypothetical protein
VGGWRQHWLTRPAPEDPEPGASSNAVTGACLTVSQVRSIPWSAAPSSTALLLVKSAFVTPIVTRGIAAKPSAIRAAAVLEAPVSFQEKETGAGWRKNRPRGQVAAGQRGTVYLVHERHMCKSIHHRGGDRASCRMLIALGENHRESGVTLKARVTWGAVNDSLCTVFSTPAIREDQETRPLDFSIENGIERVWNFVVFIGRFGAFGFFR